MTDVGSMIVERSLGSGSTGTVYLARDPVDPGRRVALKRVPLVADPAVVNRLRSEAEVVASLHHPNIVQVFDLTADEDGFTMTMEYAPGGSLADRLHTEGRLGPEETVAVLAPIADAVQAAHDQGVLHMDLKPSNVLTAEDGRPLLADFGVARRVSRPSFLGESVVGTAEYLDPAVAGGSPPSEQSDIYGLGIIGYECLAGRPPFEGNSPLAVMRTAAAGGAPRLSEAAPGLPAPLVAVVERAMAVDPKARYRTASELADALRASIDGVSGAEPMPAMTMDFGPRPLASDGGVGRLVRPPADRPRDDRLSRVTAAIALGFAVTVAIAVAAVAGSHWLGRRARPSAAPTSSAAAVAAATCPTTGGDGPAVPPGGEVLSGVGDDGCPIEVVWSGGEVTVTKAGGAGAKPPERYQLGEPGDQAVLGDWDCNGSTTLGVYRPDSGDAFVFDQWPATGTPVSARPVALPGPIRDGRAEVVHPGAVGSGQCDELTVRPR